MANYNSYHSWPWSEIMYPRMGDNKGVRQGFGAVMLRKPDSRSRIWPRVCKRIQSAHRTVILISGVLNGRILCGRKPHESGMCLSGKSQMPSVIITVALFFLICEWDHWELQFNESDASYGCRFYILGLNELDWNRAKNLTIRSGHLRCVSTGQLCHDWVTHTNKNFHHVKNSTVKDLTTWAGYISRLVGVRVHDYERMNLLLQDSVTNWFECNVIAVE